MTSTFLPKTLAFLLGIGLLNAQPSRWTSGQEKVATDAIARANRNPDDAGDYIVQYRDGTQMDATRAASGKLKMHSHLRMAHGRLDRAGLNAVLADPDVIYVSPDRDLAATHFPPWMLNEAIGYRFAGMAVPERPDVTGKGIGIAIIDSGVSADDYLKNGAGCTATRIVFSQNFVTTESTTDDLYGHGTHVAGIATGNGRCLPGAYLDFRGVAPDANIVNLRALDGHGQGKDSYVIAAIDRAIALKTKYKIKVINLSLGRMIMDSFSKDPLCQAVEKAWKAGITVVVAAGNNGRDNSMGTLRILHNCFARQRSIRHYGWRDALCWHHGPRRRFHRIVQFQRAVSARSSG